jgi:hypothetical protein
MYDQKELTIHGYGTPCHPLTVRERLNQQEVELQSQLNKVRAALDALDNNPGVSEVLELLGKAGF